MRWRRRRRHPPVGRGRRRLPLEENLPYKAEEIRGRRWTSEVAERTFQALGGVHLVIGGQHLLPPAVLAIDLTLQG